MVDTYLCDKVQDLEHTYPTIAKPTDQVRARLYSCLISNQKNKQNDNIHN
jgi:hypothetical protein